MIFYEVRTNSDPTEGRGSNTVPAGRFCYGDAEKRAIEFAHGLNGWGHEDGDVVKVTIDEAGDGSSVEERIWGRRPMMNDFGYLDLRDVATEDRPDYKQYLELKKKFGE